MELDEDVVITLVGTNSINTVGISADGEVKNSVDGNGSITFNGTGTLFVTGSKSAVQTDGVLYGLGGKLVLTAERNGTKSNGIFFDGTEIEIERSGTNGIQAMGRGFCRRLAVAIIAAVCR